MGVESDDSWTEVFGPGVVEIGEGAFAVARIDAGVDRDLRLRLRFVGVRHGRDPVELDSGRRPLVDAGGFTVRTSDGERLYVRPFEVGDSPLVTHISVPDLTVAQMEKVARAYGALDDDGDGPWSDGDEPIEFLRLVLPDDGSPAQLRFTARPWLADPDDVLTVWRVAGAWGPLRDDPIGDEYPVDAQMASLVIAAIDAGQTITPAAAILAGWSADSTVVGQDPFAGIVRTRMLPEVEAEVRRLVGHADRLTSDTADLEYAQCLLSGYDGPDRMAWTEEVFGVLTRLATALDRSASHTEEESLMADEWISTIHLDRDVDDWSDDVTWRLDVLRVGGPGSRRHWWPMTREAGGDPRMEVYRDESGRVCRVVVHGEGPLDGAAERRGLDYMVFGSPTLFGVPLRGWSWRFSGVEDPFPFAPGVSPGTVDG